MSRRPVKRSQPKSELDEGLLGPALQRYFCQYLINQRQLSPRTVAAYRDTFRLLLEFFERCRGRQPDDLRVSDLDADAVLAFLDDLERQRRNCARSRNLRLTSIRSFVRHAAASDPLLLSVAQRVLAIPTKRFDRRVIEHLTREQMQALLDGVDVSNKTGLRDRILLTLMYNTGARVSEIAALTVGDLRLDQGGSIHIRGKGRKHRNVPLWRESVRLLRAWLGKISPKPETPLVPNARGRHMTRSGIESRLRAVLAGAQAQEPSIGRVRVSPHTIRHTTAMHLLQSGVDLSVIAMWLGHESIQTTHQYLKADLDTKRRALSHLRAPTSRRPRIMRPHPALSEFLNSL
jgi:site-specific recombinase XerD